MVAIWRKIQLQDPSWKHNENWNELCKFCLLDGDNPVWRGGGPWRCINIDPAARGNDHLPSGVISSALMQNNGFHPVPPPLMVPLMSLNDICWQWNGALSWSQHIQSGIRESKPEDGRPWRVTVGRPRGPMNLYVRSSRGVNVVLMEQCFNTWLGGVKTERRGWFKRGWE